MPGFGGFPKAPALTPVGLPSSTRQALAGESQAPPEPMWWEGSDIEWMVYWWLTAQGVQFDYLYQFRGGRHASLYRGQEFDFLVTDRGGKGLVIGVHGDYWHYRSSSHWQKEKLRKDLIRRAGYRVVYVRGSDLQSSLDGTMREALHGIQTFSD